MNNPNNIDPSANYVFDLLVDLGAWDAIDYIQNLTLEERALLLDRIGPAVRANQAADRLQQMATEIQARIASKP